MPAPGDLLADRYRILAPLGAGGMATVHRARDERLGREVAIKVLLPNLAGDPATAGRFEREARAMAAVAHPGLVAVFDVDAGDPATGREPFVVMELCPGGSLADRLGPGRPLAADELVPILVAIADALAALHGAGFVHRDVKPSNILFAADRVKLADFGLVRSGAAAEPSELTDPGTAIGTLGYLAPERLRGEPGGTPADVYALATVAHLGLTGSLPRPAGSVRDLVAAAPFRAPAVSAVAPVLGSAFDPVVLDGLAIEPSRRPDAVTFGARLATALGVWTRAGRPGSGATPAVGAESGWRGTAGSPPVRAEDGDQTTAIAIPIERTQSLAVPEPAPPPPPLRPDRSPASRPAARRPVAGPGLAATILLAALVVVGAVVLRSVLGTSAVPSPVARTPPAVAASASVSAAPSVVSPSVPPTPSPVPPTADPALAALDDVAAAIEGARGGKDGLKGKEANDLETLAGRVRAALDAGDRSAALDRARELDRRVGDATKGLKGDSIERLRDAAAALVAALGG